MHLHKQTPSHTHTHSCTYTHKLRPSDTHSRTYTHKLPPSRTHTHTHKRAHAHTYIHTHAVGVVWPHNQCRRVTGWLVQCAVNTGCYMLPPYPGSGHKLEQTHSALQWSSWVSVTDGWWLAQALSGGLRPKTGEEEMSFTVNLSICCFVFCLLSFK